MKEILIILVIIILIIVVLYLTGNLDIFTTFGGLGAGSDPGLPDIIPS